MNPEYAFSQSLQAGDRAKSTGGLTLRDYFAAQALQCAEWEWYPEYAAKFAYERADAMLAERAKGGET